MRISAAMIGVMFLGAVDCGGDRPPGPPLVDGGDGPASAADAVPDVASWPDRTPQDLAPDSAVDAAASADARSDRAAADSGFACGTATCASNQVCVLECNCSPVPTCTERPDGASCPGGPCPGDPSRCGSYCPAPQPRCQELPAACNGVATAACLITICPGNLAQGPFLGCACPP
jgi:hypothetical protein